MKRSLNWLIGVTALAAAQQASAQTVSATATASATAAILQPVTLVKNTDLSFGSLVRPSIGANTVTIDQSSGARSLSGGGDASLAASTNSRATYSVGGEGGASFSVTVPGSFTLTRTGGTETLPVSLAASAQSGSLNGSLGSVGTANFGVGGSLPLSSSTVPGDYHGTFDVTVGYN